MSDSDCRTGGRSGEQRGPFIDALSFSLLGDSTVETGLLIFQVDWRCGFILENAVDKTDTRRKSCLRYRHMAFVPSNNW